MYCNQIFSILKKKTEPVIDTPVEDLPIEESTSEENSDVISSEENSESVSVSESESVSEEITSEVSESEEPVEVISESESEDPVEEPEEIPTEEPIEESPTYVVANVIVCASYEIASRIARCEFGESALAIDTTLYPVVIGDTYRDGVFYDRLGNVIERNLTESEQIEELTRANALQAEKIASQEEEIALLNDTLLEMLMG